jgi:MOSC domain-containing protein YiiM
MSAPRVVSVNVGVPVAADWAGDLKRTAIRKHPVDGRVRVGPLGLEGDQVADTRHHGGEYQAVYAFGREDLDWWSGQLGQEIPDGQFGENLTTAGIDVNEALIGEQWRIGTTILEVVEIRIPCNVFKGWMRQSGFDHTAWVKRFTAQGRPGPYLRVVQPGELAAGDSIEVVYRPDHAVTVSTMFKAFTTDRDLMPLLLAAPVPPKVRALAEAYVQQQAALRR